MKPIETRARQLTLDLDREPSFAADEFLVSPSNERAHALIECWPAWPDPTLLLCGPRRSGKSHLAAIWAARSNATIIGRGTNLPTGLGQPVHALIDDCDRSGLCEADLFHLLNLTRETGGSLFLTARSPPDLWGLTTPDLLSRLRRTPLVAIEPPDTPLLRAVLVKLFSDRQIRISTDVVAFAALHCERSIEAITTFVAAVDEDALAAGRRITRLLANQTLERLEREKAHT